MMFTTDAKAFQAALKTAGRVISPKPISPILSTLKIATNDNRVTIVGTNVDITFETTVSADVDTEGTACIPFEALSKFVSAVKSSEIKITVEDGRAKISAGRNRISLLCGDVADYPNYRVAEGELTTLDAATFCASLRYCLAAASTEEARYYLCGVFLDEQDADLNLWGTNGHIASRVVLSGVQTVGGGGILPADVVNLILSVVGKEPTLELNVNEFGWSAIVGATRVWGKVIDGSFPDMRRMLSQFKDWTDAATIEMDQVHHGLNVGVVGSSTLSDKSNKIIVKSLGDDALIFRGGTPSTGVGEPGRAEVDATIHSQFAFAVNAKYFIAGLAGIDPESRLTIRTAGENGMQFEPSQSSSIAQMSSVVLPMRVAAEELADV